MGEHEWSTNGNLNRGFQGHIRYSVLLPEETKGVEIQFEFDKREVETDFQEWNKKCADALLANMTQADWKSEYADLDFYKALKSEINISIYHNGECLGSAHRDKMCKEIKISEERASEGFQPHRFCGGNLEISVHVWNVLNDDTKYKLHVLYESRQGEEDEISESRTS